MADMVDTVDIQDTAEALEADFIQVSSNQPSMGQHHINRIPVKILKDQKNGLSVSTEALKCSLIDHKTSNESKFG